MNLETALSAFTELGATWVLWLLIGLSVLCLSVIAERVVCYASTRANGDLLERLGALASKGEWDAIQRVLSESPAFEARVAEAGLCQRSGGAAHRMQSAQESVRLDLERNLALLGTVGANAPFVGLLGTVIGIIGAFGELQRTEGMLSPRLMAEIGEALGATAVGLLVALPAVAAFNLFRRVVEQRIARTEMVRQTVLGWLEPQQEQA